MGMDLRRHADMHLSIYRSFAPPLKTLFVFGQDSPQLNMQLHLTGQAGYHGSF
jgi:hypothetical protein